MTEQEAMKYPLNPERPPRKDFTDPVIVVCYGDREYWERADAIAFYEDGMFCCEGSEADRYKRVVYGLRTGRKVACDSYE